MDKRRRLIIIFIAIVLVIIAVGYGVYRVWEAMLPRYQRSAMITDIAWGADGSLYMIVNWFVVKQRGGDNNEHIASLQGVYRLDPDERVVRRLSSDESGKIIERWPNNIIRASEGRNSTGVGWIGSKYVIHVDTLYDTYMSSISYSEWVDVPGGRRYIARKVPTIASRNARYGGTWVREWSKGDSVQQRINAGGGTTRISPDDRYVVYRDTPAQRIVLRCLPEGREVIVPDSVIPAGSDVYPTTEGLLVPALRLLVDPVTFDTGVGWDIDINPTVLTSLGPTGEVSVLKSMRGTSISISRLSNKYGDFLGAHSPSFSFSFSVESITGELPESWKKLSEYPKEYNLSAIASEILK